MGNMSINFSISNAFNFVKVNAQNQMSASQKLATGSKINSSADGAASLAIMGDSRANLGAIQNQLDYTVNSLDTSSLNSQIAGSRIADTDMVKEYINMIMAKVQTQASMMVIVQQNKMHESVLRLVK